MKKGLKNEGDNHCFLNVVIQILWHLRSFRSTFVSASHRCAQDDEETCVFCSLRHIFLDFESSESACIPPCELRRALSHAFAGQFEVGQMADASEALTSMHSFWLVLLSSLGIYSPFCFSFS
jgi:uncharacterized UBP type Zn finger protein